MRRSSKPCPGIARCLWLAAALTASSWSAYAQSAAAPATLPAQAATAVPTEVALTDKHMQGVIDAQRDYDAIAKAMPDTEAAQNDPKYIAQFEAAAAKNGFASYAEYNGVVETVSNVLSGFDPKTKTYIGPEAALRQQIAAVESDTQMPATDKKVAVDELNVMLKLPPPPAQNKANIDLVAKYYDRLVAAVSADN